MGRCGKCGRGEEIWEHIWEECTDWGRKKGWQEAVRQVLGKDGEGEEWMRKVEEMWLREMEGREEEEK